MVKLNYIYTIVVLFFGVLLIPFLIKDVYENFEILSAEDTSIKDEDNEINNKKKEENIWNDDMIGNKIHEYDNKFLDFDKQINDMDANIKERLDLMDGNTKIIRLTTEQNKSEIEALQNTLREAERLMNEDEDEGL